MSRFTYRFATIAATVCLSFFAIKAFAENVFPFRYAQMEVTYASGFYDTARSGTLSLNTRDGETSPSSMTFTVEGRKLQANLNRIRPGRCGDIYQARLNVPNERIVTDLELTDYSQVRCRLYVRHKWHASVSSREPDGSISKMEMEGDPQD